MKNIFIAVVLALFWAAVPEARASEADPDGAGWRLINQDAEGNLLYMAPDAEERSDEGFRRVWAKFETRAVNSPSPMLFLNEIDCVKGLIKRLEVRLYKPTCSTSDEPVQKMSFDGQWDRPSSGIEEYLREAICREDGGRKIFPGR